MGVCLLCLTEVSLGAAAKSRDKFLRDANSENRQEKTRPARREGGEEYREGDSGAGEEVDREKVLWVDEEVVCLYLAGGVEVTN